MKTLRIICITIVILCSFSNFTHAQFDWSWDNTWSWRFGILRSNLNIRAIGIGNFTQTDRPFSALHVNTNLMDTDPDFTPGEVFRTDCPAANTPFWRMLRGGFEMASFSSPTVSPTGSTNDLFIETPNQGSNIVFRTFGISRMIITDGKTISQYIPTRGFVGIGADFYSPQSLLHLNGVTSGIGAPSSTYIQITNSNTGSGTSQEGFKIGITMQQIGSTTFPNAELIQQEDADMLFYTGDANSGSNFSRMVIKGKTGLNKGFIGIGEDFSDPQSMVHINSINSEDFIQITNTATGSLYNNGFKLGINMNGDAELNQQEPNPMNFSTSGVQRMTILGNNGFVGIGNLYSGYTPQSLLHLNQTGNSPLYVQWTNDAIGSGPNNGFKAGIDFTGIAQLIQQGNEDMQFYTNNTQRMVIVAGGDVGIHTNTPDMPLHIFGDGNNKITTGGWYAGIHLENHAVIAWDDDGTANNLFMGHPSWVPQGEFYCGLAPGLTINDPANYVYRIIGSPQLGTPPNAGDFEFFHNVLAVCGQTNLHHLSLKVKV